MLVSNVAVFKDIWYPKGIGLIVTDLGTNAKKMGYTYVVTK